LDICWVLNGKLWMKRVERYNNFFCHYFLHSVKFSCSPMSSKLLLRRVRVLTHFKICQSSINQRITLNYVEYGW
jgi:hypothetical protein